RDRDPAVPGRPGAATVAAGRRPPVRTGRRRHRRPRAAGPLDGPAGRPRGGVRRHRHADRHRRRGGGARHPRRDRPRRGTGAARGCGAAAGRGRSQRVAARLSGLAGAGIADHEPLVRSTARLDDPGEGFAATATLTVTGGVVVELDTRGAIDVAAERARLERDRAAAEKEAAQARAKLANEAFLTRAPAHVVEQTRQRLAAAEEDLARIAAALDTLSGGRESA